MTQIFREHGRTADLRYSRLIQRSYLRLQVDQDASVKIELVAKAAGMRSDVQPVYDPLVEEWLRLLGGAHAEKLLDWLASYPRIDHKIAGLYLQGPPDVGKGMLGKALAELTQSRVHAPFSQVIDQFQDTMTRTPFVWADEESGSSQRTSRSVMNMFKKLITGEFGTLNAKGKTMVEVEGYWRVLLTANSDKLLRWDEDVNEADLGALVQRMLHIHVPVEAAEYLRSIGGQEGTHGWPEKQIPQHIMWLRYNRQVIPGSRLLVEGVRSDYHDSLTINTGGTDLVVRTLGVVLNEPARYREVIFIRDGMVLINTSKLHKMMETLYGGTSMRVPSPNNIIQSIKHLSQSKQSVNLRDGGSVRGCKGSVVRVWPVDLTAVIGALDRMGEDFDIRKGVGDELWNKHAPEALQRAVREFDPDSERLAPAPTTNGHTNGHSNGHAGATAQVVAAPPPAIVTFSPTPAPATKPIRHFFSPTPS